MRRRPPSRLWSLLVVLAMLWSHASSAFHGGCAGESSMRALAQHAAAADAASGHHCDGAKGPRAGDPACEAHCATPAASSDITRIPPVPALAADACALPLLVPGALGAPLPVREAREAPRLRPHGPTGHPAALLLI